MQPGQLLDGRDKEILAARDCKLAEARERRKQQRQDRHEQQAAASGVAERPAIDFAAVRAAITMTAVLQLLGFEARQVRGIQQRGPCPLHGSTSGTGRCFSVNLERHTFHCFKCGRSGNALPVGGRQRANALRRSSRLMRSAQRSVADAGPIAQPQQRRGTRGFQFRTLYNATNVKSVSYPVTR